MAKMAGAYPSFWIYLLRVGTYPIVETNMLQDKGILLAVVSLVLLAGCVGGGGGDGAEEADWCSADSSTQFANPQTGEKVALEIVGLVEEDGRTVCKGIWTTNTGEVQRMELFWNEDESYRKMITYDEAGKVVNEIVISDN